MPTLIDTPRPEQRSAPSCALHTALRRTGESQSERWYVAETILHKEALAFANIQSQGFPCFYPRFRTVRSHARKHTQVLMPLFPGYIFIRLDPERRPWRAINGTRGVKSLLGSERDLPRAMPQAAMDCILARCDNGIVSRWIDEPKKGQTVRIVTGPFADRIAAIDRLDALGRVSVLLDILGRQTRVTTTIDNVAPAE